MASDISLHARRVVGDRPGTARWTTAAVLTLCAVVNANAAPAVTVLADRLLTGHGHGEFVPRFAGFLPNSLRVPAGTTATLPADATYDAIEVAGTLRCPSPFRLRVVHLMILPGGTFDCRAAGTIEIRDVAIDTRRDPYQLGNGLIVAGTLLLGQGRKTLVADLAGDAPAGATTLELAVPSDWTVGDELLLPDMRQIGASRWPGERILARREGPVYIAARTDTAITLSKPLDFEHQSVLDPGGAVVLRPRIANLSRPLSVRSENARGSRGHIIVMGHAARWEVRAVSFEDLGRTTAERLDSTVADPSGAITRVGGNHIGRYAFHVHHARGTGSVFSSSVLRDQGVAKAAHATHNTDGSLVEDSIALGFVGAGFITEDGPERRNVFRGNVAAFIAGNGLGGKDAMEREAPFAEGAGFWMRGMENTWERNEAWNNHIGFQFMYRRQVASSEFDVRNAVPVSFKNNVALGNYFSGLETWGAPHALLGENIYLVHNGSSQVHTGSAEFGSFWVKNLYVLCSDGKRWGVESSQSYIRRVTIDGGWVRGCGIGVLDADVLTLRNVTLQNAINIDQRGAAKGSGVWENVVHEPLGDLPKQYVIFRVFDWRPEQPLPSWKETWEWTPAQGSRYRIVNWQGTGETYFLYRTDQLRSKPAYPALPGYGQWFYAPEAGLTVGETWDRWGIANGGGVIAEADAVELEGLVNGVARRGSDTPLGPPRAVLNTPNTLAPAVIEQGQVHLWFTPTGDSRSATPRVRFRVNNGRERHASASEMGLTRGQHFAIPVAELADGVHTVTTWRDDLDGEKIASSELRFSFRIERQALTASAAPQR